ncbi:AraC family transcriptional regulator [Shewanella acanthi]|uniref:AraC family transcriptional regulator n=1 Tax=Shewanella acanthi TaxID=2864212 RepID=UPI001C65EEBB|nr:AraC family transcriptional regulator [Shewanella acanthi]QYJ78345.1 AraC family transcriptional regulator [Shewanella acanthi]
MINNSQTLAEGFPSQKLLHVSLTSIARMQQLPLCKAIYVTDAGYYPEASNHRVLRESGSKNYVLIFCVGGTGYVSIGGKHEVVEEDQLILLPAHVSHEYGSRPNASWRLYWVHFNGTEADDLYQHFSNNGQNITLYLPQTPPIVKAFETTIRWVQRAQTDNALIGLTCSFVNLLGLISDAKRSKTKQLRQAEERIRASLITMEQTLKTPMTLEQLAQDAKMSVPYYCALFKKLTGSPPIQVYTKLRIKAACQLMTDTKMTIKQMALEVGFEDAYYFSRAFKKVMGMSPKRYKEFLTKYLTTI